MQASETMRRDTKMRAQRCTRQLVGGRLPMREVQNEASSWAVAGGWWRKSVGSWLQVASSLVARGGGGNAGFSQQDSN